jgi:micrococcal nuclease
MLKARNNFTAKAQRKLGIMFLSLCSLWLISLVGLAGLVGCSHESALKASRIYDGDSLVLSNGQEIRLIGIDAPEKDQPGADLSRSFMEGLITGKDLRIEKGVEEYDKYKRLLVYLYQGDTFINAEMIKNGYAVTLFIPPNDKYKEEFTRLEAEAKESKKGLWRTGGVMQEPKASATPKAPETPRIPETPKVAEKPETITPKEDVISWQDAGKYVGKEMTVEGLIVHTYKAEKACFLDFSKEKGNFYVVIFPGDYGKFSESPEKLYANKKIRVKGKIIDYKGTPEIIVNSPDQIEIVKE